MFFGPTDGKINSIFVQPSIVLASLKLTGLVARHNAGEESFKIKRQRQTHCFIRNRCQKQMRLEQKSTLPPLPAIKHPFYFRAIIKMNRNCSNPPPSPFSNSFFSTAPPKRERERRSKRLCGGARKKKVYRHNKTETILFLPSDASFHKMHNSLPPPFPVRAHLFKGGEGGVKII